MSAKSQHNNILLAIAGFVAVVIIVAVIGFFAFDRETMTLSATLKMDGIMPGCQYPEGKEVVQVYLSSPSVDGSPRSQLVAAESYVLGMDSEPNPYRISIKIDPFWLRHYDETSDIMIPPAPGTQFTLEIKGGGKVTFTY